MSNYIAVYGSLRHGEYNFERFQSYFGKDNLKIVSKNVEKLLPATMVNVGSYPALLNVDVVRKNKVFLNNISDLSMLASKPVHASERIHFDILECSEEVYNAICQMEESANYFSEKISIDNKENVTIFYADDYLTTTLLECYLKNNESMVIWDGDWKKRKK